MNVGHHETTDADNQQKRIGPRFWLHDTLGDHDFKNAGCGQWRRRIFDYEVELAPHEPVVHVSWYEAMAYCQWAGRRYVDALMNTDSTIAAVCSISI